MDGDAKALGKLKNGAGEEFFIATQNLDSVRVFTAVRSKTKSVLSTPCDG